MVLFTFMKKILDGDMWRDSTHVDELLKALFVLLTLYLIEMSNGPEIKVQQLQFQHVEDELEIKAKKNFREMQQGDLYQTYLFWLIHSNRL